MQFDWFILFGTNFECYRRWAVRSMENGVINWLRTEGNGVSETLPIYSFEYTACGIGHTLHCNFYLMYTLHIIECHVYCTLYSICVINCIQTSKLCTGRRAATHVTHDITALHYCTLLFFIVLHFTVMTFTAHYCAALNCTSLYFTKMYCTVLLSIV